MMKSLKCFLYIVGVLKIIIPKNHEDGGNDVWKN